MNKKYLIIVFWLLIILFSLSTGVFAQGPWGGRGMSGEKRMERIAKELGLTDQQKAKYLIAAKQVEDEAKAMRVKNKDIFNTIKEELLKDLPDSARIKNYIKQISDNNTQIQFKRMEQMINLRKELTPEQKTKLEKLMEKRKARKQS